EIKRNSSAKETFVLPTSFTERAPARATKTPRGMNSESDSGIPANTKPQIREPDDLRQLEVGRASPPRDEEGDSKSQRDLEQIETELSLIVAKETDLWNFTNLRQR